MRNATVMLNCVGAMPEASTVLDDPRARLHDYRKPARPGRKVGHVNVLGLDPNEAHAMAERLGIDLG